MQITGLHNIGGAKAYIMLLNTYHSVVNSCS